MFVNVIKSYRNVVAVCDEELLGKVFEDGNFQINVKENFYKGEQLNREKLLKFFERMSLEDSTFNIVGRDSVETALKSGIISEESVGEIQGIPFALVLA